MFMLNRFPLLLPVGREQLMINSHRLVLYQSHTGVMDYDEACFMHLTPGVVHNFPKAVGV